MVHALDPKNAAVDMQAIQALASGHKSGDANALKKKPAMETLDMLSSFLGSLAHAKAGQHTNDTSKSPDRA